MDMILIWDGLRDKNIIYFIYFILLDNTMIEMF